MNPTLTAEQAAVANCSSDARLLVTADAGTGKTHTLVARVEHLLDAEGLKPGSQVLVLTFTNAAVKVITDRLELASRHARMVQVSTVDRFALRIIHAIDSGDQGEVSGDFDERIQAAMNIIRGGSPDFLEFIGDFQHILVDEVQDLVGVRSSFIRSLIGCLQGGFTFLGDPAQGIYNWQCDDPDERQEGSGLFYRWLRKQQPPVREMRLRKNFRAQSLVTKDAAAIGGFLNDHEPSYSDIRGILLEFFRNLRGKGSISEWFESLADGVPTAILCRTNKQALKISDELRQAGSSHVLQPRANDRPVAPWVASLLGEAKSSRMTRRAFKDRLHRHPDTRHLDPDAIWQAFKKMDRRIGGVGNLDVERVNQVLRLKSSLIPDALLSYPEANVVVSTIHRAKGLQYDRVLVVEPERELESGDWLGEELRVFYVALTRASKEIWKLRGPMTFNLREKKSAGGRVYRTGTNGWECYSVELRSADVHRDEPAGGLHLSDVDPVDTQGYIREKVRAGDAIELELIRGDDDQPRAVYAIKHEGRVVGITSSAFAKDLRALLLPSPPIRWPGKISGLWTESVDTVAGTQAAGRRASLGPSGLWNRVRVYGLGYVDWGSNDADAGEDEGGVSSPADPLPNPLHRPGQLVRHPMFGVGEIVSRTETQYGEEAWVKFEARYGSRRLLLDLVEFLDL